MDNIANYYVLPLLKLNKASFGGDDNFVNSYVTQDEEVVVEVKDKKLVPDDNFMDHRLYLGDFDSNNTTKIVYSQPEEFMDSILKFSEGKYSAMSDKAKESIILYSGLPYNKERKDLPKKENGKYPVETSRLLLVLFKAPALKALIEKDLGVKISNEAELHDMPNMNNFYPLPE